MKKIIIIILFIIGFTFLFWVIMNVASFKVFYETSPVIKSTRVSKENTIGDVAAVKKNYRATEKVVNVNNHFDDYLHSLPTLDDLQNLSMEEVHHTPEMILNGGELIGRIQDQAENDPSKRMAAMDFFRKCAEDHLMATPLRAVCLNKIYKLVPDWQIPLALADENISKEVNDLALKLP